MARDATDARPVDRRHVGDHPSDKLVKDPFGDRIPAGPVEDGEMAATPRDLLGLVDKKLIEIVPRSLGSQLRCPAS
jgi:hypothetical protein